jgi:hypothetical protein
MNTENSSYSSTQITKFTRNNQALLTKLEEENKEFYDIEELYRCLDYFYKKRCEHHFDNRQKLICMMLIKKGYSLAAAAGELGITTTSFTRECSGTFYIYFKNLFQIDKFDRNKVSDLLIERGYKIKSPEEVLLTTISRFDGEIKISGSTPEKQKNLLEILGRIGCNAKIIDD